MLMSTLLSQKFTSVDIFQCLRHGIRNHDSVPKWELYVLNLNEKKNAFFFLNFLMQSLSVSPAVPLEVHLSVSSVVYACHVRELLNQRLQPL